MSIQTRPLSSLIDEVRFNTNNTDDNRYSDGRLMKFFNSAQRQIQKIIYNSNPTNSPFLAEVQLNLSFGVNSYTLPADMFSISSVRNVTPVTNAGKATTPLKRINEKERSTQRGYYLRKDEISFAPSNIPHEYLTIVVTYDKALEDLTLVTDTVKLPRTCEDFLMAFVERKINYVDSSSDITNSQIFTEEEKSDIVALFQDDIKDVSYPTMTDNIYTNY